MQREAIFEIYCQYIKVIPIDGATLGVENFEPEVEGSGDAPVFEGSALMVPPGCFTLVINGRQLHLYWTGMYLIEILSCQLLMARESIH